MLIPSYIHSKFKVICANICQIARICNYKVEKLLIVAIKNPPGLFAVEGILRLFNLNHLLFDGLRFRLLFREEDAQDTVFHLCFDLVFLDVVRE